MKDAIYYIIAAIAGGFAREINNSEHMELRTIFTTSFTGVIIGIVFGFSIKHFTGSYELGISVSALMGVWGFNSLTWLRKSIKDKTDSNLKK